MRHHGFLLVPGGLAGLNWDCVPNWDAICFFHIFAYNGAVPEWRDSPRMDLWEVSHVQIAAEKCSL